MQDTSLEAYEETRTIRERQGEKVFNVLLVLNEATALELVYGLESELDVVQVRRRISDLKKQGRVEDSGERRKSHGRTTIVWRIAKKKMEQLGLLGQ